MPVATETGERVVLRRAGVASGMVTAAALVAAAVVLTWQSIRFVQVVGPLLYPAFMLVAAAVMIVVTMVRAESDVLILDEEGITVVARSARTSFDWSTVTEVGWRTALWPYNASGVMIRPRGGPWDSPGPNAPMLIGLPIFGFRARRRAKEAVRRVCEDHGVPFTGRGSQMTYTPAPGSPLRRAPKP